MSATKFTTLMDNATLAKVERMRLLPLRRLTNRSRGEHLAGKGGVSTEFNDYRDYAAGVVGMGRAIRSAIAEGATIFDLLQGDEKYKYDFGAVDTQVYRLLARPTR